MALKNLLMRYRAELTDGKLRFSKQDEPVVFYYQNRSPKLVHTFRLHMLGDGFRRICYNNIDENVLGRS